MAIITLYNLDDKHNWQGKEIAFDGYAFEWIVENITEQENFAVYQGAICEDNEISKTDEMLTAETVSIVMLPAGPLVPFIPYIVAAVVAVAVTLLIPQPDALGNVNRQQGSPNNELSDRRNRARPNQRIVDVVGEVLSIPDTIQPEFARYNADKKEERIGAYAFARGQVDVKRLRDGDNLISDTIGSQAEIYYPFKSPNNSAPDVTVNASEPAIDEKIVGVYQSTVAIGQTLDAPEVKTLRVSTEFGTVSRASSGIFGSISDGTIIFDSEFQVGDLIELDGFYVGEFSTWYSLSTNDSPLLEVFSVSPFDIVLLILNNPEWQQLPLGETDYDVLGSVENAAGNPFTVRPEILLPADFTGDTYKITSTKVDRLLANIYCPSGLYKRSSGDKEIVNVNFALAYYRLDDNFNRVGALQIKTGSLSDKTDDQIGDTIDVNLGAATFVEWYVYRTTFEDTEYNGQVVDVIKLKSFYGLYDIDRTDFGNITMVQTKRTQVEEVTAIANPEVNARVTEMVYKYQGNGVFDTVLTKNTQAMQSLISKGLDNKIGRMSLTDLDLDLLLQTHSDIESSYQSESAGQCSYSFDSTNTSAQEALTLIANSVSCILWREGRVLKSWFESPQSIPEMVFTHKSKEPNSETWNRNFKQDKDGISFKYIDGTTYNQEVLLYPANSTNPKQSEIPGIKGIELATWRMMREYNKLRGQRETVDFTAKEEGRFVKPSKLISVVKGTRVGSTDGYVMNVSGLTVELSQEVNFTAGDVHSILFKKRDGSTKSILCTETTNKRIVNLSFAPAEALYFGNDALKTEFSFGNEARLTAQKMLPQTIDASDKYSTRITAVNYSDDYYKDDPIQPVLSGFSAGFDSGFF